MKKSENKSKTSSESQGLLVILSAPSGCGKTTVVDRLLKRHPDWMRSVSVTTREPRLGEKKGEDYIFVTPQGFRQMEEKVQLLESAKVFDHYYGTPKLAVMAALDRGKTMLLAIDVQGMKKLKKAMGKQAPVTSIFILPPSVKILRERLEGRKTESPAQIEHRIETAQEEIKEAAHYDHTVMNQTLEQTVLDIEALIQQEEKKRRKTSHVLRSA